MGHRHPLVEARSVRRNEVLDLTWVADAVRGESGEKRQGRGRPSWTCREVGAGNA